MSIWNVVENLGQSIASTIHEAIDSTVAFVSDMPGSETPDSIYMASDNCDWAHLGLESKEVQQRCFDHLQETLRDSRALTMSRQSQYEIPAESLSGQEFQGSLGAAASGVANVGEDTPWWDPIGITDMEACIPIVDPECMDDPEEWLAAGSLAAAGTAVVAGSVYLAGVATTTTVITEAELIGLPSYVPWIAW